MYDYDAYAARQRNAFLVGFLLGTLGSAVIVSLVSPRSGAQNRELVRERGLELKDRVSDQVSRIRNPQRSPL